jgi:hypothetical protein
MIKQNKKTCSKKAKLSDIDLLCYLFYELKQEIQKEINTLNKLLVCKNNITLYREWREK